MIDKIHPIDLLLIKYKMCVIHSVKPNDVGEAIIKAIKPYSKAEVINVQLESVHGISNRDGNTYLIFIKYEG